MNVSSSSQISHFHNSQGEEIMNSDDVSSCPISVVHRDILQDNILARLDGPTLAAIASTSNQLNVLSSEDWLWRDICHKKWPSTANFHLQHIIISFPSKHRSFYADSYSTLHHGHVLPRRHLLKWSPNLVSAVDIYYKNDHLLSKVLEKDTGPESWTDSSFCFGLLDPSESVVIPGKLDYRDLICEYELENNMKLSWVLIDPIRTRSASLSRPVPINVDRDWSTGDVEVRFGTVLSGEGKGELVECGIVVTCGGWDNENLHVKEVRLVIEDVEGNKLGWRESLVILQEAMENGERQRAGERGGYAEFAEMKRERREQKLTRERRNEEIGVWTGAVLVIGFWIIEQQEMHLQVPDFQLFPHSGSLAALI